MKNPVFLALLLALVPLLADAQRPRRAKPAPVEPPPVVTPVASRCSEEVAAPETVLSTDDPRSYLMHVAQLAQQRSRVVGVAELLLAAARDEVREAEAARLPQLQLQINGGYGGSISRGVDGPRGAEARASLVLQGPLWDWGRTSQLIAWRSQLAEAAAAGRESAAEQIALQAVALSLDRSRYLLQTQVYGQYARKMACLVDQLDSITRSDRGRASELVQAQKSQQQAELALVTTQDLLKNTETRLRRLVGEPLPPPASLGAVLSRVPDLAQLQKDLLAAPDLALANAQALAAARLAEATRAGQKPQLSMLGSGSASRGNGHNADAFVGVQLSVPLWRSTDAPQLAAAQRRADAANLQRDETLDLKVWRLQELHDAAGNSLDRARRITELLRASQQLRAATLLQWQQLGRRSLFDVMGAEADYYALRVAHINALFDAQQAVAVMGSMGRGVLGLLQ